MNALGTTFGAKPGNIPRIFIPLGAIALIFVALSAKWWLASGLGWKCPFLTVFALPCPSCGSTRAFAALADFELVRAFRFNPLIVLAMGALLVAPFGKFRPERWGNKGWVLLAGAVGLNWIYLLIFLPR